MTSSSAGRRSLLQLPHAAVLGCLIALACLALNRSQAALSQSQRHVDAPQYSVSAAGVHVLVAAFLASPPPPVRSNITEDAPVFFHHQRKTGGTSLRAELVAAAAAANLSVHVPCFAGVPCTTYAIGAVRAALYAGHFPWGERHELSRRAKLLPPAAPGDVPRWHDPIANASCVTMFREPLSRLESCYYYRFVQERRVNGSRYSCLNNLGQGELRELLLHGRSRTGRGCLNEPFRILSGLSDEDALAALSTSAPSDPGLRMALQLTLSHAATCVPLLLERPDSLRLLAHHLPQLALPGLRRANQGKVARCQLSPQARATLSELAGPEQLLYAAVARRVDALLAGLPPSAAAA